MRFKLSLGNEERIGRTWKGLGRTWPKGTKAWERKKKNLPDREKLKNLFTRW